MIDWLAHRVRATPDATAVIDADAGTDRSYADLDAAVEDLAGRLAALGFESGDHLGLLLETRLASVRLLHAATRVGCVLVPLSARLTAAELESRIERADLAGLICGADTEPVAVDALDADGDAGGVPIASIDPPTTGAAAAVRKTAPAVYESPAPSLDGPQVMLYTSGTTGEPKLVVLTARNLLASAGASAFRLGVLPEDRWLDPLSIYHMGGLAPIVRAAIYGTTVVVGDTRGSFDPAGTTRALAEYDCTGVSLVPTMLRRMLDADTRDDRSPDDTEGLPGTLRFVLLGGAPASEDLIERCERGGVPVCPTYGMTETASQVATARSEDAFAHTGTVGQPLLSTDLSILDGAGEPVETGETGKIVVSGPTVTPGYYGDRDATATAFSEEGFHTDDLGYRDADGRLWVTGRRDDRILTGGETVDPTEVRATLREHPDVRDAAVVGLPDTEYGERVGALVAADGDLDATAVTAHCRERLAGFKLPRTIGVAEALPRTTSGTVERAAVRERLREDSE